jgi:hypothetical protein
VNSNYIVSGLSGAAAIGATGNTFRNNVLVGTSLAFSGTPATFEHNVLAPMIYLDGSAGGDTLTTAAAVDALTDTHADGTIAGTCAMSSDYHLSAGSLCIDAGTPTGAPPRDKDGDPRDSSPDIGPDEYEH